MQATQSSKEPLTMSADEAAKILGTTPDKVRSAILNGTMPVGMVGQGDHSSHNRTIIVRRRFEKWMDGELRL
ncbi:hypothetical protein LJC74_03720 [Eubacteriales bacterium OttesenSCG-928-A19]|nr:hypothetical protein [Eubacteriales bacterium OttesenSCG-928-A19]